jgi:hypothetical protein
MGRRKGFLNVGAPPLTASCSSTSSSILSSVRAGSLHPGHTFVSASVDTRGHLAKPIMRYIRTLSDNESVHSLIVIRGSFLASVHWKLSLALAQIQGFVYHSCALFSPRL